MTAKPSYEELEKRVQELEASNAQWEKVEAALRFSEERFRTLAALAPVGIYLCDPAGACLYANPKWCEMAGLNLEQALGDGWVSGLHPEDRAAVFSNWQKMVTSEGRWGHGYRFQTPEGKVTWVYGLATPQRDAAGKIVGYVGINTDITALKQAQERLGENQRILSATERLTNAGGWEWDVASQTMTWTDQVYRIHDLDPHELPPGSPDHIAKSLNCYSPEDQAVILGAFQRCRDLGEPYDMVFPFTTAKGRKLWIRTAARPVLEDGRVIKVLGNIVDITGRKMAEEALLQSDERHRAILRTAMDGFWLVAPQGGLLDVNETYCRMSGFGRQELLGMSISDLDAVETAEDTAEHIKKVVAQGEDRFESRHRRKDGSVFDVEVSLQFKPFEGGRLIAFIRDITRQKKSQTELQQMMKTSADIVMAIPSGLFIYQFEAPDRLILLSSNPEAERLTGTSVNEWMGREFNEIWPEAKRLGITENYLNVIRTGVTFETEDLVYTDNRISGAFRIRAFSLPEKRLAVAFENITERKQAELALRESEEKFRNFTEQSFVGFYIIQDGIFQYVNPKFADIFGYTVQECLDAMAFSRLVHPEDLALVQEQVNRRVSGEIKSVQYRFRGIKKTGETIHVVIYGSSLVFKGRPAAIGTMLDITRELEFEARLAQSQRMESIGALAAGIAHDFNNILFPIIGLSEMLLEDLPAPSIEHENVGEIFKAAMRAGDLVKQILAFSRQAEQRKMPVRVQQIVKEAVKLARSTIPADIEIGQDIDSQCPMVMADPTQLHQIAINLITNAFHAVEPTGGRICVSLRKAVVAAEASPHPDLMPGDYAQLSVTDTGHGIEPSVIGKIFEPYFTTKDKGKGTGLGLSTVYGIVKAHGGHVHVTSTPGRGAAFNVYLPLMKEDHKAAAAETRAAPERGTERILLVDDEPEIARMQKIALERLGYTVTMRTSSVDALEALRANPGGFDLVVTDMAMPIMAGDHLALEMLKIKPGLRVIICTGFSQRLDEQKAKALGIKGFVMKPVLIREMASEIRRVLGKSPV